jgi:hypothetical protein
MVEKQRLELYQRLPYTHTYTYMIIMILAILTTMVTMVVSEEPLVQMRGRQLFVRGQPYTIRVCPYSSSLIIQCIGI